MIVVGTLKSRSTRPPRLNKTDVLALFEMIHQTMKINLKNYDHTANLKTEIAYLAQITFHPTNPHLLT